jgi:transcriptional regulator with XRE-family HTH domain
MAPIKPTDLGSYIKHQRQRKGLSLRALGELTSIDAPSIGRMEQGEIRAPAPDRLVRIARALEVNVQDLYALAGYKITEGLPEFQTYLRTKYDMPAGAINELEQFFDYVNAKYEQKEGEGDEEDEFTG